MILLDEFNQCGIKWLTVFVGNVPEASPYLKIGIPYKYEEKNASFAQNLLISGLNKKWVSNKLKCWFCTKSSDMG